MQTLELIEWLVISELFLFFLLVCAVGVFLWYLVRYVMEVRK